MYFERLLPGLQQISHWTQIFSYYIIYLECSRNVMERMSSKYLIKLEVDWNYDGALNTGNLVVYASEDNVELRRMESSK